MTSREQMEQLLELIRDPEIYIPKFLYIKTKDSKVELIQLNEPQLACLRKIKELRQANKPVRLIILKARQMGFSTVTEAEIFHDTTTKKNRNSLIVAHVDDSSSKLFGMSKLFFDMLDPRLRPMHKANNAKMLLFENPTNSPEEKKENAGLRSAIRVTTAESPEAARSSTYQNVHCSEVAFWRKPEEAMLSILQTVPNTPDTMVIVESTANGVGGYFYEMWNKAMAGENDFVPLFFGWNEMSNYRLPPAPEFERSEEEQEMAELYELDDEQLMWRRWCIANNCGGDIDKFRQEYPINADEAFTTSGRPAFDAQMIYARKKYLAADKDRFMVVGDLMLTEGKVQVREHRKGCLKIYKPPIEGHEYLIAADVAEGVAGGDSSTAQVFDRTTHENVATWKGLVPPDLFGSETLWWLARLYKRALVAPEENNHGLTTIIALRGVYNNIYRRQTVDKISNKSIEKHGFKTTTLTRPILVNKTAKFIREGVGRINDMDTLDEMLWFAYDDSGKAQAVQGKHDDLVMAFGIGVTVLEERPYIPNKIKKNNTDYTYDKTGW